MKKETAEETKKRAGAIAARLAEAYPDLRVPLAHRNNFELLVAVILSAQSTDEIVNRVTPELFRRYPSPDLLARAPVGQIEKFIRRVGLFHVKGLALKKCARQLVEYPAGEVSVTLEALTRLAGVGRKVPLLEKTRGLKPLVDTESVCRHATVIADREKKVIV